MSDIAQASIVTRAARRCALRHSPLALALAVALGAAAPGIAAAQVASTQLPTGGSIAGGTGTIHAASGATLTIDQTSSRMALTWSAFDIGSAATVTFNQPSSSAAVLNLIQGGNPTQIFGNLNANGQVFLINTNGMIFGSTAQINVGGLVASTLGTSAADFMSGNDVLDAGGNTVALMSNGGTINAAAGAVDLIGGKVLNTGTITASAGNINLVGADKVTLTFESGGFGVVVDKALQLQLDTLAVDNSGTLSAPGGVITLQARAAQGMFDQLINNSGTISAAALSSGSDGSVSLVANGAGQTGIGGSGSIDVGGGAISISTDRGVQQSGTYTAGSVSGSIGGNASFSGGNRIASLGSLDVGGNLALANTVDLTQSGALTVAGTSGFSLGSHALTLDNAGNDFRQAVGLSSGATTIVDSNALTLGTLATGNLVATSNGALDLGSGAVTGTLAATSNGGAIVQSASNPLTVTGTSNLNAGSGAITLTTSGNDFGQAVSLTGGTTQIADSNALTLGTLATGNLGATSTGALNLGRGTVTGALVATSNGGAIAQSASNPLSVTGTSTLNAGGGAITLTTSGNDFGQAVGLTGGATAITDSNALILGTLATGNLTATSVGALNLGSGTVNGTLAATSNGGAIVQSASNPLTVTGTSNLNAASGAVTLTNAGNDFGGAVSLTGGGIALADANALTVGGLNLMGANSALSLSAAGTLTLPGSAIATGAADLSLHSGGALVTTAALSGHAVSLSGDAGLTLAHDVTATGTLALSAVNSAIVQSAGAVTVSGTSSINAGSGTVALTGAGNHFGQAVGLIGGSTAIADSGALTLGTLATGNLAATSNGALHLGNGTVAGTLAATSNGGAITQSTSSPLTVGGSSTLDAGGGAITLTTAGNDFAQAVNLRGGITQIADSNALTLGTLATGNLTATSNGALHLGNGTVAGTLAATSNGGAITQSTGSPLTVTGTSTLDAGSGAITLTTAGNDFGQAVSLIGAATQITDSNALTLGTLATGSLAATSNGALHLGSGMVSGTLAATSNGGAITQSTSSALGVTGTSAFNAGSGAITLTTSGNDFGQAVSLSGGSTAIVDSNALSLGALATGDLAVTSSGALQLGGGTVNGGLVATSNGGAITQSANSPLTITGTSTLDAGSGAIALTTSGNHFGQAVSLTGGATQITDSNALTLGALATGDLTAISNGALNLGGGTVGGALTATSNGGAIGQSTALGVLGASTLDAGGGAIALLDAGNDFVGAVDLRGSGIQLADRNDLRIAAVHNGNNAALSLRADGSLTLPGGAIDTGSGDLSLVARQGTLRLDGALRGHTLTLSGGSGLILGDDVAASGNLLLSTDNAAIVQTGGALTVGGDTAVSTGSGSVALTGAGNHFAGSVAIAGGAAQLRDSGALTLGTLSVDSLDVASGGALNLGEGTVRGALQADSGNAAITQRGALAIGGGARLAAGSGAITLDQANRFAGPLAFDGGAVRINALDALTLGASTAATLQLTGTGALGQTGALRVSGATALDTGNGAIALDDAGNDFQGVVQARGGAIAIADRNDLAVAAQADGALALGAGGTLRSAGTLGGGTVALGAGADLVLGHDVRSEGALQLRSGGSIVQTAGALRAASLSGGSVGATALTGDNAIAALGAFGASQLEVRTLGDLRVTGPVAATGALRLQAGGGMTLAGTVGGGSAWLQAGADLAAVEGGRIVAGSLSGRVGGRTALGTAAAPIDNRIDRIGDVVSPGGFSLSNGQSLTLGALDGSTYSIDAGTAAVALDVRGDLLQADRARLRDGTGTFSASGRIGTAALPVYVLGVGEQRAIAGMPPAYIDAVTADGRPLAVTGSGGGAPVVVALAGRVQHAASHPGDAPAPGDPGDPGEAGTANADTSEPTVVGPGLRLPADRARPCEAGERDCLAP